MTEKSQLSFSGDTSLKFNVKHTLIEAWYKFEDNVLKSSVRSVKRKEIS